MSLESRIAALLEVVQSQGDTDCRAQVDPARERARALLSQARRTARARVHAVIAEERATWTSRVSRAEAHLATRTRMAHQEIVRALLRQGHERLGTALAARWSDESSRRSWIEAALQRALAALPRGKWIVAGPATWNDAERRRTLERLAADGVQAECIGDASIDAGLRISAGGIVLDATLAGLLDDRAAVEGRLLHLIEESRP